MRAILSAALDLAVGIGEATTATSGAAVEGKEAQTEEEGEGEQHGGAGGGEPERVTPFEVIPKILVPMICTAHELESVLALIDRVAYQVRCIRFGVIRTLTFLYPVSMIVDY